MLPTVTSGGDGQQQAPHRRARRVAPALRHLDAALFRDATWFAIDTRNQRVPGVVVPTLEAGLSLVGRGPVATIVGRLRPEVLAVDIDLTGTAGWAVAETVSQWCTSHDLWHLTRPSGGAEGRCHVFIAPGRHLPALKTFLDNVRATHRASGSSIDLRSSIRPLSAPHRHGSHPQPYNAQGALDQLQTQPWATTPTAPPPARSTQGKAATPRRSPVTALQPTRRREHRELPAPWRHFLATGERPPLRPPAPGAPPHTRSTWEAIATATMLRAGWSAEEAWAAIEAAHPDAMDHARADRRRWTRWVWNRAVLDDANYRPPAPPLDPAVAAAVTHARARLRTIAWSLPPRRRHAALLVGHALLDRMTRTASLRVPCPERDLVLDTGLTDRKTIRAQLRLLDGELGQLHRVFTPRAKDSSSFEFAIRPAPATGSGVRQIPPPSRHTPLPSTLPPHLPRPSPHLLRALSQTAEPADLPTLAQHAQLTSSPTTPPTPSQVRSIRAGLHALARLGLAHCTETGHWIARDALEPAAAAAGQRRYHALQQRVQQERASYRSHGSSAWEAARAAAAKANRARERAWWEGLSPEERRRRSSHWQTKFAALNVTEQANVKAALAGRDARAGINPAQRHDAWLDTLGADTLALRASRRAARYAALPAPLQIAYAQAWQQHRQRFGIRRGSTASATQQLTRLLPDTRSIRDETFLHQQLPQQLALPQALLPVAR